MSVSTGVFCRRDGGLTVRTLRTMTQPLRSTSLVTTIGTMSPTAAVDDETGSRTLTDTLVPPGTGTVVGGFAGAPAGVDGEGEVAGV